MDKFLKMCASVASVFLLCNPVHAEEMATLTDGLRWGGYASANVNLHPGGRTEATWSEASLFLSWDDNSAWRFFSEIELEAPLHWQQGRSVSTNKAYVDVERLYADYVHSDQASIRAGRFLTPIGRWNLIHADPLVWTTHRPRATEQLFPLNINGLMLHGALPQGSGSLEYFAFSEAIHDMHTRGDEIPFERTRGVRLAFSGAMEAGVTALDFSEDTAGHPHYRLLGLDFLVARKGWELSGEVFQRFRVGGSGGAGHGAYIQGVAPIGGGWSAVGRLETMERPAEASVQRWLIGAAWRMDEKRVFKLDYMGGNAEQPHAPKGMFASFAVLF